MPSSKRSAQKSHPSTRSMRTVYSTYAGGSLHLVIVPPSYNLRWPAIVTMFSAENSNATLEICQDHFAAVTHAIFDLRSKHNYQGQIDDINALINRIGNEEPSEGPSRYDNLDSVLTIAKGWLVKPRSLPEPPVYLKRTAGVSLRSARFDNKVRAGEAGCR